MQKCGFCSMISGLLRRAMCVDSRRSSESYYRELGDQDTLKIEDKSSDASDESGVINDDGSPSSPTEPTDLLVLLELCRMTHRKLGAGRFLTMHKRRKKRLVTRSLYREEALLDDLHFGQVQCILNQSVQWRFNAFTLENVSGGRCLPVLCVHLFHMYGLLSHFQLDAVKAWKLFSLIEEGYHSSNPYHNSIHAADVTQAMHCFLQQKQIRDHMEPLEIMASLLAAIAHDLDHPGVNQPFLIATSNHLATLYKNTSVLENHHWRSAVSCLIESGVLDHLAHIRATLQNQISSLILATDITRQQEYLSQFKGHLDTNTLDMTKKEHRHLVLQIALKCADISNPCRPWDISRKWSLKVCEEFFRQGDYEKHLKLPVTALCDRHTTSIPRIQTGFFKFVVTPLITEWNRFLHNDLSAQMLKNLLYNQNQWDLLVAQEIAEETGTEISDADMVDHDLETNISDSSELLLPLRRGSYNPGKQSGFREQLRRLSVPLNVFQDSRFKKRGSLFADQPSLGQGSPVGSERSIHSQLSVEEKVLSTEKLLPNTSIASITTPVQASRLRTVFKDGSAWKLVRQQTFPPLESTARSQSFFSRPSNTGSEEPILTSRYRSESGLRMDNGKKEGRFINLFKRSDTEKIESGEASQNNNVEVSDGARSLEKENCLPFGKPSADAKREGSQLRDNITSVQLSVFSSDQLQHRRKSMPAEAVVATPKEKKVPEVSVALPHLIRTLSSKEAWTHRRGSAPAPVAPSEFRGLNSLSATRHSVNGSGRRKPNPIVSCTQWLAKATYSVQERTQQLPRRSSLPVEVFNVDEAAERKAPEPK